MQTVAKKDKINLFGSYLRKIGSALEDYEACPFFTQATKLDTPLIRPILMHAPCGITKS